MSASTKTLTVVPAGTYSSEATDVICFKGAMDSAGNPMFPRGLAEWIPTIGARTGLNRECWAFSWAGPLWSAKSCGPLAGPAHYGPLNLVGL